MTGMKPQITLQPFKFSRRGAIGLNDFLGNVKLGHRVSDINQVELSLSAALIRVNPPVLLALPGLRVRGAIGHWEDRLTTAADRDGCASYRG